MELLYKCLNKINECITAINSYDEVIAELKALTNDLTQMKIDISELQSRVIDLGNSVDNLDAEDKYLQRQIDDLVEQVNNVVNGYDNLQNYVDNKFNELSQRITNQSFTIYSEMHELIHNLQLQINTLAKRLEEIDTQAYNPWSRILQKESLQKNLDYAYSDLADSVPVASEYSELGLTAEEYSAFNLVAREYSLRGRKHLKMHYVFSPVFGFKAEINNALTSIVNFLCNTLSATEYSEMDLTADEYANLDLSASDYYRYNPTLTRGFVQVSDLGGGLTRAEYEKLEVVDT